MTKEEVIEWTETIKSELEHNILEPTKDFSEEYRSNLRNLLISKLEEIIEFLHQ